MHRIFGLLTLETFVLILSLFLLAYVKKKNDLGKLFQYIAASVSIFIAVLMIGSVFTCCMPCYRMGGGKGSCGPMMNECHMGGQGSMSCPSGKMDCKMKGNMEDCCMENMQNGCTGSEEKEVIINIDDSEAKGDSTKKKVIIRKSH